MRYLDSKFNKKNLLTSLIRRMNGVDKKKHLNNRHTEIWHLQRETAVDRSNGTQLSLGCEFSANPNKDR